MSEASDRGFWRAKEHYYFRISVSSSFLPSFLPSALPPFVLRERDGG